MSKVSAEMPSKAQQSCVGTDSTKPCGAGLATAAGGAVRMTGAVGTLTGCTPSFCVAFIGESAIRAVSLRGPAGATLRLASGLAGGKTGLGGADAGGGGGFKPAGGGGGTIPLVGGGGTDGVTPGGGGGWADFPPTNGGGGAGVGGLKLGAGGVFGGRTPPDGAGGGSGVGRLGGAGGRADEAPPVGGSGFGEIEAGGRTTPEEGGRTPASGGFAPAGGTGGRLGRLIRAVSFSTGTVGRFVVRGGRVIRTVSFFGSFKSAIAGIYFAPRERRHRVSQTSFEVSTINRPQATKS